MATTVVTLLIDSTGSVFGISAHIEHFNGLKHCQIFVTNKTRGEKPTRFKFSQSVNYDEPNFRSSFIVDSFYLFFRNSVEFNVDNTCGYR